MMRRLLSDTRAATGAEFALLVALFMFMLFGIIDTARFAYELNEAQKATQAAVRHAVVTDFVADGLDDYDFAAGGYPSGDPIPADGATITICTNGACSPNPATVGTESVPVSFDSAAFDAILARARASYPSLQADELEIEYRNVGLGYAGDPNGSDIAPLVIARATGIPFQPMVLFGLSITLPDVESSMTMEDGQGVESYSS